MRGPWFPVSRSCDPVSWNSVFCHPSTAFFALESGSRSGESSCDNGVGYFWGCRVLSSTSPPVSCHVAQRQGLLTLWTEPTSTSLARLEVVRQSSLVRKTVVALWTLVVHWLPSKCFSLVICPSSFWCAFLVASVQAARPTAVTYSLSIPLWAGRFFRSSEPVAYLRLPVFEERPAICNGLLPSFPVIGEVLAVVVFTSRFFQQSAPLLDGVTSRVPTACPLHVPGSEDGFLHNPLIRHSENMAHSL